MASSVVLSHESNTIELASVTGVCKFGYADHLMHTACLQQDSEMHLGHQSHLALGYLDHLCSTWSLIIATVTQSRLSAIISLQCCVSKNKSNVIHFFPLYSYGNQDK